jgi:hypothetical protein
LPGGNNAIVPSQHINETPEKQGLFFRRFSILKLSSRKDRKGLILNKKYEVKITTAF